MLYSVYVYDKIKIAYYSVPKCASRSITSFFDSFDECRKLRPCHFKDYKDYFTFSFVRNPYSRVISLYNDKVLNVRIDRELKRIGLERYMRFDNFVDIVTDQNYKRADKHIKRQCLLVPDYVDYIGKLESISIDFAKLMMKIDKHIELPYKELPFIGKTSSVNYKKVLTKDIKNKISEYYNPDFERFNYDI